MKDSNKFPSQQSLNNEDEDCSEGFEEVYRNMIPSDATLAQNPFLSRNFVVCMYVCMYVCM